MTINSETGKIYISVKAVIHPHTREKTRVKMSTQTRQPNRNKVILIFPLLTSSKRVRRLETEI